ncbi:anti-repressor SinI family protein [Neobacillus vireti]
MVMTEARGNNLDEEWVELIKKALELGISAGEISEFLTANKRP